ncbi:MAG: ABC transporter permease [Acidobacteria bacterium]|nr:ABC transporter permease [Acidobacteriota bacterium]
MFVTRFFQRPSRRRESELELEDHLQRETEENIERGMSPDDARRAAHIKLGNVTRILADMEQQDRFGPLEALWQDLRFGFRMLLKHRGFALVSLFTLAIGIGANTAIFTVVDATLIRPLPYPNANRTVMVWEHRLPDGESQNVTSPATFLNWQRDNTVFDQMAAMFNDSSILYGDTPEQIGTATVSPNFFSILGANAAIGRILVPAEDGKPSSNPAAVLSFELWQRRFASDPNVLGTQITLDDKPFTVVGVMPREFQFFVKQQSFSPKKPEIWVAWHFTPQLSASHGRFLQAIGLLRPGVTLMQAQESMLRLSSRLEAQDPASMKNWSVNLVPLRSQFTGDVAQGLRLLLAAVGMVLLIACANVATLNLARASTRRHEIAIRMAVGASAMRVVRQVLTESCLLALFGGLAGIGLGYLCLNVLKFIAPANLIPLEALHLDVRVFGFAFAVSLISGVLFGIIPAIDAARTAPREPLQEGAMAARTGDSRSLARRILVVSEVAIALVLLTGAGLLIRSFQRLVAVDPGFRADHILTAWIQFPSARYEKDEQKNQFFAHLLDSIRAIPGVRSASADGFLPFAGIIAGTGVQVEGRPILPVSQQPDVNVSLVEPDFFKTLGIPLISGRTFNRSEAFQATNNVVISQSMAQMLWPGENPLGKRVTIYMKRDNKPSTVIGVVGDVKHSGLATAVKPTAYWSYPELGFQFMTLVIRTEGDPRSLIPDLRQTVLRIDKNQPIADVVPMETLLSLSVARTRFATEVMAAFASVAILLAIIGIYGIISYDVEQRTREIGIRMALGAQRTCVIHLVLSRGLTLAGLGIVFGIAVSLGVTRLLASILYETKPHDPATFILVSAALAMVAICAGYLAVRRISNIEPMTVLRRD